VELDISTFDDSNKPKILNGYYTMILRCTAVVSECRAVEDLSRWFSMAKVWWWEGS
jgi:hypothetical protein